MPATKEQLAKIAEDIADTRRDVRQVAKKHGVEEWTDDDCDALEEQQRLFRCVECDEWKDTDEKDDSYIDTCWDCALDEDDD